MAKKTKQFQKTIKTLDEFETQNSDQDLRDYLGEKPIEIDEQLFYHISCGYVASNCNLEISPGVYIGQNGEAESSFKESLYSENRYTYMTVKSFPDDTYWYLGILPDLNRDA